MLWNQLKDGKRNVKAAFKNTREIIPQEKKQRNTTVLMLCDPLPLISASEVSQHKLLLLENFGPKVPPYWLSDLEHPSQLSYPGLVQTHAEPPHLITDRWNLGQILPLKHPAASPSDSDVSASCFILRAPSPSGTPLGLVLQSLMHPIPSADGAIYSTTSELLYIKRNGRSQRYITMR